MERWGPMSMTATYVAVGVLVVALAVGAVLTVLGDTSTSVLIFLPVLLIAAVAIAAIAAVDWLVRMLRHR